MNTNELLATLRSELHNGKSPEGWDRVVDTLKALWNVSPDSYELGRDLVEDATRREWAGYVCQHPLLLEGGVAPRMHAVPSGVALWPEKLQPDWRKPCTHVGLWEGRSGAPWMGLDGNHTIGFDAAPVRFDAHRATSVQFGFEAREMPDMRHVHVVLQPIAGQPRWLRRRVKALWRLEHVGDQWP